MGDKIMIDRSRVLALKLSGGYVHVTHTSANFLSLMGEPTGVNA
jgi:hypothetical protein